MKQNINLILFDILGYSSWMKNPNEPLDVRIDLLKKLRGSIDAVRRKRVLDIELFSHFYADNILLWTTDETVNGARYLMFYGSFLISLLLHAGTPVRGAITCGEAYMSHDEMIYQGPPLIEAHEMERSQKWLGCVIGGSTLDKFGDDISGVEYATKYDVPIKGDVKKKYYVLDWPRIDKYIPQWCHSHLCNVEDLEYLKERAPNEVKERYDSTIDFYNARA